MSDRRNEVMDTIGKKLALKEKMAYGCGDAASNIIWASMGTFLMFYYTDRLQQKRFEEQERARAARRRNKRRSGPEL